MSTSSPVVITRILRPKRRVDLLSRPRLTDFLHENIDRKLILVSAAAGYGKTSLLVDFAHDVDLPICWYSLSENDRDPRVFTEYLIASVRQSFPAFGQRTEAFLNSAGGGPLDPASLANLLVNDIYQDIPDYFIIVLDDYHRAEEESINFLLDTLLQHLPDNCHVILSSRTIPRLTPKGMALLVARREIEGLGTRDLCFTAAEICNLFAKNFNQRLPLEQAEALSREAEGWITGILLTTHSMWKGLFASILEAKGSGSKVYDYLANEVFSQQKPDIQNFLRSTSVLDEMTPWLCNRLLDRHDSRFFLSQLEDSNLFISHVERDNDVWYRYHNLFQQFLQAKAEEAGQKTDLHARAGALLESAGQLPEAISQYQAARRFEDAARVISLAAPAEFDGNHWQTVTRWIDALPKDVVANTPRLLAYRATIYAQGGQIDEALPLFDQADHGFQNAGDQMGVADVRNKRATALRFCGRFQDAQASCQGVLNLVAQLPRSNAASKIAAEARRTVGICLIQTGKLQAGAEELRRSLAVYEEIGDRYGVAQLHSDMGTALRMTGNMTAADMHFDQAVVLWNELGASASLANTLNNVGLGYHLRGQYAKALETYERALAIAQETALWRIQATVLAGMGDVYRDLGQYDQAFASYNEARPIAERAQEAPLVSYILDALGNTYILTGDFLRADELIRQAYDQARERRSRQSAALYFASLGVLAYERSDPKTATDYLAESVHVLQEIGARRDLPKVRLHLAHGYYLNGQWDQALGALDTALEEATELGYDQFLEPIGRRMLPFLRLAMHRWQEDRRLASLIKRIETAQLSSVPDVAPGPAQFSRTPTLRIYAFGEVRVLKGEELVDQRQWGTAKAKELFFYLLCHPFRTKQQIGITFWPDLSAAKVRSSFHITVYRLRRALGVADGILYNDDRYYFNTHIDYWYDVQEFERLLAQAERVRDTDPGLYESSLKQASQLYRGDFLESLSLSGEDWHAARSEELRKKYMQATLALADLAGKRGAYDVALEYYERIASKDSYIEAAHRGIMDAYLHLGDRNAALRHYLELESHLQRELGVSPAAETTQLYEHILQNMTG